MGAVEPLIIGSGVGKMSSSYKDSRSLSIPPAVVTPAEIHSATWSYIEIVEGLMLLWTVSSS